MPPPVCFMVPPPLSMSCPEWPKGAACSDISEESSCILVSTILVSWVLHPCTQVAAASKSAPAPPANIKEQLGATKKPPAENRIVNDAGTHLKRLSTGQTKGTEGLQQDATAALSIFKSLSNKKQKVEFSQKILQNRKSLQWIKTWQQQYEEKTATKEVMISGYMTRTHMNL